LFVDFLTISGSKEGQHGVFYHEIDGSYTLRGVYDRVFVSLELTLTKPAEEEEFLLTKVSKSLKR
jgi:hypothetical protein